MVEIKQLNPFGAVVSFDGKMNLADFDRSLCESLLRKHGLVAMRNVPTLGVEEFKAFCLSLPSYAKTPLEWDFGSVMDLKSDPSKKNYIFSNEKVPFHWDGAFHKEPAILAFHCLEAPAEFSGGETIFTDTSAIWESLDTSLKAKVADLEFEYKTDRNAHYGGTVSVKVLQKHPVQRSNILRFAEPVLSELNPVSVTPVQTANPDGDLAVLEALIDVSYQQGFLYTHRWQKGDVLLADNFRLLHGRNAYLKDGSRWIRRLQIMH